MSVLVWLAGKSAPVQEIPDNVRVQADEIRTDGGKEIPGYAGPDWNETNTDDSSQLEGLRHRQISGDVHESVQYAPNVSGATVNYNVLIDRQVASSGTAAAREAAGEFGHGTAQYTASIEPLPDVPFGQDYFTSNQLDANEGSRAYIGSPVPDVDWQGVAAQTAMRRSRQAYAGLYDGLSSVSS